VCLVYPHTKTSKFFLLLDSSQGGPEKILLETIDPFVVNSNFCELPCTFNNLVEEFSFIIF